MGAADASTNISGGTYVAYSFASVESYSKVGSCEGNGTANGPFVYTGFRPAYVTVKGIDAAVSWYTYDNKRDTYNPAVWPLWPHHYAGEVSYASYGIDLLSNGFKFNPFNSSTGTFIYMAFAEAPFKYANAR